MTPFEEVLAWVERELGVDASTEVWTDAVLWYVTERCTLLGLGVSDYGARVKADAEEADRLVRAVSDYATRELVVFRTRNLSYDLLGAPSGRQAIVVCRNTLDCLTRENVGANAGQLQSTLAPDGRLLAGADNRVLEGSDSEPPRSVRTTIPAKSRPGAELGPAVACLERAHAVFDRGDADAACEAFNDAIAADPLSAEAHLFHGIASDIAGEEGTAMASFRNARLLDPSLWAADFYLGLAYERRGVADEAIRCLTRMLASAAVPRRTAASTYVARLEEWRTHMIDVARLHVRRLRGSPQESSS